MSDDFSHLPATEQALAAGITGDQPVLQRRAMAKAITLLESTRPDHRARADELLNALLPRTGRSFRLGISGVPGVGKSTFIEALGLYLIGQGHRVAVLAIDPSSSVSGGSILGDKTRMEQLSVQPGAYIRPSPSSGTLGGVAEKTRESMLVAEAAGYDVVIIETVGVGQSETAVSGMTDMFCLLQLPNAGDDLQAIKKGIVELADLVVINKADIDPKAAEFAKHQFENALGLLRSTSAHWRPTVLTLSAQTGAGVADFWQEIERHRKTLEESGELAQKRRRQALDWMWTLIDAELRNRFRHHEGVRHDLEKVSRCVTAGSMTPAAAAHRLLNHLHEKNQS